ncbi:hypothetical protein COU58_04220 [Candidatus Pacearchaeota archaeon CG10_big_fil_rev_8_21_14_0_10_32_42]|nr:MAG: hypothetical protein COU58_04220 [Candidatus Pacearchaeota archaeon CG10_big_fil_rev_8_21_14_0_10_32_42]
MAVYQGPIKAGTSEEKFRETGKSVPLIQGPVRPSDNEQVFRSTGKSTGGKKSSGGRSSGGGSSGGSSGSSGGALSSVPNVNVQDLLKEDSGKDFEQQIKTQRILRDITLENKNLQTNYNPRTNMYESFDPNQRGTSNIVNQRLPTPEEQEKINKLNASLLGSKTFKEFEERLEKPRPDFVPDYGFLENIKGKKTLPYGTREISTKEAQEKFNVFYAGDFLGKRVSDLIPEKSKEKVNLYFNESKTARDVLNVAYSTTRELPKWIFFSPAFMSGTSGTKQVQTEKISEGKFEELAKSLKKIEKKIVSKKTASEQTKVLNDIYKTLKTTEAKENFKKYVIDLYEKGIYKGVPLDKIKPKPIPKQGELTINILKDGGQMQQVGAVSGITQGVLNNNLYFSSPKKQNDLSRGKIQIDVIGESKINEKTNQTQKTNIFFKSGSKSNQRTNQQQRPDQASKLKEEVKQNQPQKAQQRFFFRFGNPQEQLQKQRFEQRQIQRTTEKFKPKEKINHKIKTSEWLQSMAKKPKEEIFSIFGKRFGKDLFLGTAETKDEAEKKLGKFLIKTLGRSGKIKKDGEELSFKELNFGKMFRPSKKDTFRVVQKARFSLGSQSEIGEIQMFKKSKSKRKKNSKFNWFG